MGLVHTWIQRGSDWVKVPTWPIAEEQVYIVDLESKPQPPISLPLPRKKPAKTRNPKVNIDRNNYLVYGHLQTPLPIGSSALDKFHPRAEPSSSPLMRELMDFVDGEIQWWHQKQIMMASSETRKRTGRPKLNSMKTIGQDFHNNFQSLFVPRRDISGALNTAIEQK